MHLSCLLSRVFCLLLGPFQLRVPYLTCLGLTSKISVFSVFISLYEFLFHIFYWLFYVLQLLDFSFFKFIAKFVVSFILLNIHIITLNSLGFNQTCSHWNPLVWNWYFSGGVICFNFSSFFKFYFYLGTYHPGLFCGLVYVMCCSRVKVHVSEVNHSASGVIPILFPEQKIICISNQNCYLGPCANAILAI